MGRKEGTTTRIIDRCIQEFFENGFTYIYEGRVNLEQAHKDAMERFKMRMSSEHPHAKYTYEFGSFDNIRCYKVKAHNL